MILEQRAAHGVSHVPSQPLSVRSPRGMVSCDSGLPPDTQNPVGSWGNVFEGLPGREGQSSAFFENPKNLASSSCGLGSGNTVEHWKVVRRDPRSSSIPNPRFDHGIATLNPWRNFFSKWCDGPSEMSDLGTASRKIFPNSLEFQSWKVNFKTEVCANSVLPQNKWPMATFA